MNKEIYSWLQQVRQSGMSEKDIRTSLQQQGWSTQQIDQVVAEQPCGIHKSEKRSNKLIVIIILVIIVMFAVIGGVYYVSQINPSNIVGTIGTNSETTNAINSRVANTNNSGATGDSTKSVTISSTDPSATFGLSYPSSYFMLPLDQIMASGSPYAALYNEESVYLVNSSACRDIVMALFKKNGNSEPTGNDQEAMSNHCVAVNLEIQSQASFTEAYNSFIENTNDSLVKVTYGVGVLNAKEAGFEDSDSEQKLILGLYDSLASSVPVLVVNVQGYPESTDEISNLTFTIGNSTRLQK